MTGTTPLQIAVGTITLMAGTMFAASVEQTDSGDGLQTDELQVGNGGLKESIITDEAWAQHQVVPNRVFVKFRAEIVGERRENLLDDSGKHMPR